MKATTILFGALGLAALMLLELLWVGCVLHIIWAWFAAPIFNLPALGVAQAMGVALVVGLITKPVEKPKGDEILKAIVAVFFRPALVLLAAWITLQFV